MAHIVVITLEYIPYKGGIATYLHNVVLELRRNGHTITVIADSELADISMPLLSRFFWPRWLLPLLQIIRRIKKISPDYVMISHVIPMGYIARAILHFEKIPYIVIVHGKDVAVPLNLKRKKRLVAFVLQGSSLIVCNSKFTATIVERYGVLNSVRVVYPSVKLANYTHQHVSKVKGQILSVSRLVKRKGFDILFSAFSYVVQTFPDARLILLGEGEEKETLMLLARSLNILTHVSFLGEVDDDVKNNYYETSSVFALTPREIEGDVEGFGTVYLEAALHGLPCVGTDSGGVPEAIEHERTGICVKSGDVHGIANALIRLLSRGDLRRSMGVYGSMRVKERFIAEKTVRPLQNYITSHSPLVSIIIPVYNHEKQLLDCIASIQVQSYHNYEIIIVDDGSTIPVKNTDPRIKLIRQENKGAPNARNHGFDKSVGEYVLFCDADITMHKTMLRTMVDTLTESSSADFCYASFYFGWKHFKAIPYSKEMLQKRNFIHTTSLMKRNVFPRFDESLQRFQDWDVFLTLAERKKEGIAINTTLFRITPRNNGMSVWLPRIAYYIPLLKEVKKYKAAELIIRIKHNLS